MDVVPWKWNRFQYYASKETPPSDHLTTSLSRAESVQNAPGFTSIAVEGRDKQLSQKILSYVRESSGAHWWEDNFRGCTLATK
ncbi:hypothetical protein Y032_0003g1598 [Ancylostoma ceylanicum]|uniref:Uncharacterized protein n=1 Tax=Ancylostoma ceylanicum TaxID=53326 RepID=A0A016W0D8_9BILA|nr:hypothetical protein Y032_0003g1598 [Ancylostoma ceylanicum]